MKAYVYVFLCFFLCVSAKEWEVEDIPNPKQNPELCLGRDYSAAHSWICDPDRVLSNSGLSEVNLLIDRLYSDHEKWRLCGSTKRGYELSVVIVRKTTGSSESKSERIEQYARKLHNSWGIGHVECSNGVLMFLSVDDREMYITTGPGVSKILPNRYLLDIIEEMRSALRDEEYDRAILLGVETISRRLLEGVTWTETVFEIFAILLFVGIFGLILVRACGARFFRMLGRFYSWRGRRYDTKKAEIAKLRETIKKAKIPCTLCPICLDDFKQDDAKTPIETLSCGHQFHQSCIETWLKTKNNCPICRQSNPRGESSYDDVKKNSNFNYDLSDQILDFAELNLHQQYHGLQSQRLFVSRMEDWCTVSSTSSDSGGSSDWGGGSCDGGGGAGGGW